MTAPTRTYGTLARVERTVAGVKRPAWCMDKVEPHVAIRIKQMFPRIPKSSTGPFYFECAAQTEADLAWFMARYPLAMTPQDARLIRKGERSFKDTQAEMERILLPDYAPNKVLAGIREGEEVRAYQWQAIDILSRRRSLLLGDEGGLGKTYTAAGFLCAETQALPAAVVCDAHMPKQWEGKLLEFTTLNIHVIESTRPYNLPHADVYIFRVTQLAGWVDMFGQGFFRTAVYDEPQSLRTGTSTQKGGAAKALSDSVEYRLGLTATPIYNYGDEMWNVMQFIDDEVLGTWEEFIREWCAPAGGRWRVKDPTALGTYLRENYALLRRMKPDVGQQLPKVSTVVENVNYDAKAVASAEALAHALAIKASQGAFIERGTAARELDARMRQATGVSKARAVAQFVRLLVEAGEPVLLTGWHREVYEIWLEELADLRPAMYTGSETGTKKNKEAQRFINGETDVMIISNRSGAGLDGLQYRCSTLVVGELDWAPGVYKQLIWRLDREGQTRPVMVFFLVVDSGSDPVIMEVNGIKSSEAKRILDPSLGTEVIEVDGSNLQKLVQKYLHRQAAQAA